MSVVTDLTEYAEKAREKRLNEVGQSDQFALVGDCFENAIAIYDVLDESGYDPTFVVGTTDRVGDDLSQAGVDLEADITCVEDLAGHTHYWVECSGYVVDISSDTFDTLGEIRVEQDPTDYYKYEDSEECGSKTLNSRKS